MPQNNAFLKKFWSNKKNNLPLHQVEYQEKYNIKILHERKISS